MPLRVLLSVLSLRVQTIASPYGVFSLSRSRCNYACALLPAITLGFPSQLEEISVGQ